MVGTMTRLHHALALLTLLCGTLCSVLVAAHGTSSRSSSAKHLEVVKRWDLSARGRNIASNPRRAKDGPAPPRVKNITFSNPEASSTYAGVYAPHYFALCTSRVLREWQDDSFSQL